MMTRAIAPLLALLLLIAPLPATTAAAGVPPTTLPAYQAPTPPPASSAAPAGPPIAISDEKMMTEVLQAVSEARREYGDYDNPGALARINRIGYELAQHADFYKYPFTFSLLNMPEPNSMALPSGDILVTRGMIDIVGLDDDMLACVLGHEIGHVIKEHSLHMSRRATLLSVLGNLLVAGVLISSAKNPPKTGVEGPYDPRYGYDPGGGNRVMGAAAASLLVNELMLRSFSREHEDEADQVGQRLAADAGYNPEGAERMWKLMESRAPQIREYGYLQSHPFVQERIRAAEARKGSWSIQRPMAADLFRQRTQQVLVAYAQRQRYKELTAPKKRQQRQPDNPGRSEVLLEPPKPPLSVSELASEMALATWPLGKTADSIRLARLHHVRDSKLAECPPRPGTAEERPAAGTQGGPGSPGGRQRGGGGRGGPGRGNGEGGGMQIARIPGMEAGACAPELHDYGTVVRAYRKELAEIQSLDPMGPMPPLAPTLNGEISDLEAQRQALYPHALEVWNGGVYETAFLVAFVSNFPDSPEVPKVALALGDAYSRTGSEVEAVTQYLTAWKAAPDSSFGQRARTGLRNLTPNLKELAALQELAYQDRDPEMKRLAGARLAAMSHAYDDLANGAEYLRRYPDGEYVVPVLDRLNVLADNLYGEVVLYQGFGDATKAIDRINKILTNAPLSPAAEKLRDRAILIAEKSG
jgi:Zn-dependent protease with chaperone function/outer membrane protein assembly factor BamD (BamD/ComL family)